MRRTLISAALTAALLVPLNIPSAQAIPTDPSCLPLVATGTGIPYIGGYVPTLNGDGIGPVAKVALPSAVWLKNARRSISTNRVFALVGTTLYTAKATRGVLLKGEQWHQVNLPTCLAGRISMISADGGTLIAIGPNRQVYTNDLLGDGVPPDRWTWRWGPFFWTGLGFSLPNDVTAQAYSDFGSGEWFTDIAGRRHHPIGVGTYYLLRAGGSRILPEDPWLPMDDSRAVCLPENGRARVANLDATGSTVFAVTRAGRLYTRLYDFDVSGANAIFGSYTWQTGLPATDKRWQLPVLGWKLQPMPPGTITDAISIQRTGHNAADRQLRVAGTWQGRSGIWTKPISTATWTFTAQPGALPGRALPMANPTFTPTTVRYQGTIAGSPAEVPAFDWACTPSQFRVRVAPNQWLPLELWAYDGLRQTNRAAGLNDVPRTYNAAIIVPPGVWKNLSGATKAWVTANLAGRITETQIKVTATKLTVLRNCWKLTKDGKPARTDQPSLDPGDILAGVKTSGTSAVTCA